jgi:hypothetical protein
MVSLHRTEGARAAAVLPQAAATLQLRGSTLACPTQPLDFSECVHKVLCCLLLLAVCLSCNTAYDYPCLGPAPGEAAAADVDVCKLASVPFRGVSCSDAVGSQKCYFEVMQSEWVSHASLLRLAQQVCSLCVMWLPNTQTTCAVCCAAACSPGQAAQHNTSVVGRDAAFPLLQLQGGRRLDTPGEAGMDVGLWAVAGPSL